MPSTEELLARAGYEYVVALDEPPETPEYSDMLFEDVHPGFARTRLAGRRLYRHQLEALNALRSGMNLVLVSGTGSGKTEAWVAWAAERARAGEPVRVIAVYPTLALAWDQLARLQEYSGPLGLRVYPLDSTVKKRGGARRGVLSAHVIATNPAMLLQELKKHLEKPGSAALSPALEDVDLLVLDELDYYGPREVALLLGMVEVLSVLRGGSMAVAALSATLANPGELASYLESVTGRKSVVVRGRPFRARSRVIVVLGKNFDAVRVRLLEEARRRGLSLPGEIRDALEDPRLFAEKAYLVADYMQAQGVDVPSIAPDYVEILEWFARGEAEPAGVTLVFTRSIAEAERAARALRDRLGPDAAAVATHHHLVPKEARRRIEEGARRGEVRVIVTPRTLVQGIDIGSVTRIVHLGLPVDVREFWQREGRKGRREGVEYAESIVIPRGRWDWELLRRGASALLEWLRMPLERVEVNPGNHYKALFTGAAKLVSPLLRSIGQGLSEREREALAAAWVLRGNVPDAEALSRLWRRLNFYEYGPPYGVKRVLEDEGGSIELEEIGWCDLVEKFQRGCLDPAHNAVVVDLKRSKHGGRVQRVVEWRLERALRERWPHWLMDAVENYRSVKEARWREEARFLRDYALGLVSSEVLTVVQAPQRGFGLLRKTPNRCVWRVASRQLRVAVGRDGRVRVYRPTAVFEVDADTAGVYTDYTYGFMVEGPEGWPPGLLRLGLAVLGVYLRRAHGVPLGHVKYSVYAIGSRRLIEVHEESAAGLLERLDWARLAREVAGWKPGPLDEILLLALDETAYSELEGVGFNWDLAVQAASRVAEALATIQTIEVALAGLRVRVRKPSRSLGRGAVSVLAHDVRVSGFSVDFRVVGVAYYDGESVRSAVEIVPVLPGGRPPRSLVEVEHSVSDDIEYDGFRVYTFNPKAAAEQASAAGLRRLSRILEGAEGVAGLARRVLGLDVPGPSRLAGIVEVEGMEVPEPPPLQALAEELSKPLRDPRLPGRLESMVRGYLEAEAILIYLVSLALEELAGRAGRAIGAGSGVGGGSEGAREA